MTEQHPNDLPGRGLRARPEERGEHKAAEGEAPRERVMRDYNGMRGVPGPPSTTISGEATCSWCGDVYHEIRGLPADMLDTGCCPECEALWLTEGTCRVCGVHYQGVGFEEAEGSIYDQLCRACEKALPPGGPRTCVVCGDSFDGVGDDRLCDACGEEAFEIPLERARS
jgi:hypothetical protein